MILSSEGTVVQAAESNIVDVHGVRFFRLGSVNVNTGAVISHSKRQAKVSICFFHPLGSRVSLVFF